MSRKKKSGPFQSERLNRELRQLEREAARSWNILFIGCALMVSVTGLALAFVAAWSK